MNIWEHKFTDVQIYDWEITIDSWFFVFAMVFLAFEMVRLIIKKQMSWNTVGDTVSNFITLGAHLLIIAVSASAFLFIYYTVYQEFSIMHLPNNWWTVGLCLVLADIAYYWEHRVAHRIGIGWATHTVHHSSPYFNISVAYRHGPLDAVFGLPFHLPLAVLGFDPVLILFCEMMVQLYQTALHTETIGKFPRFIEAVMNTPSHHRVHHGSNRQYIDKNYAGIFIIWDKLFGTFEEEDEKVVYGVKPALNSVNPANVYFHGFVKLFKQMYHAKGFKNKIAYLYQPPGWKPKQAAQKHHDTE